MTREELREFVDQAEVVGDFQNIDGGEISTYLKWERLATLDEGQPMEWLVDSLIPLRSLVFVYGLPQSYKSFLMLDLSMRLVLDWPWLGRKVKRANVLYVAGEGESGISLRTLAWRLAYGVTTPPSGLAVLRRSIQLLDEKEVALLAEDVRWIQKDSPRSPHVVVIIDTLSRCASGADENSPKDATKIIDGLDKIRAAGATVVVIHHTDKGGGTMRGHSSLEASADIMLKMTANGDNVKVVVHKRKDGGARGEEFHLKTEEVTLPNGLSSLVLRPLGLETLEGETRNKSNQLSANQKAALEVLASAGTAGLTSTEWRRKSALADTTFNRVREFLVQRGYARLSDSKRYSSTDETSPTATTTT